MKQNILETGNNVIFDWTSFSAKEGSFKEFYDCKDDIVSCIKTSLASNEIVSGSLCIAESSLIERNSIKRGGLELNPFQLGLELDLHVLTKSVSPSLHHTFIQVVSSYIMNTVPNKDVVFMSKWGVDSVIIIFNKQGKLLYFNNLKSTKKEEFFFLLSSLCSNLLSANVTIMLECSKSDFTTFNSFLSVYYENVMHVFETVASLSDDILEDQIVEHNIALLLEAVNLYGDI